MKLALLFALCSIAVFAQSKWDGTHGSTTVQAQSVIDGNGTWCTKVWATSSTGAVAFRFTIVYFDGITRRIVSRVAEPTMPGQPAIASFPVRFELAETGSLYVYELMPVSEAAFTANAQ